MLKNRRSVRLKGYDYSQTGAYFMTVCTQDRACLFGDIVDGDMVLNGAGQVMEQCWNDIAVHFPHVELDAWVIMPNHVHGILVLHRRGEPCVRPIDGRPIDGCPVVGSDMTGDHNTQTGDHDIQTGDHKDRPYGRPGVRSHGTLPNTVGRIVQAFKSITTRGYIHGVKQYGWARFPGKLWQRNYYEHIIRNDHEMNRIREYIDNNPVQWELDRENPCVQRSGPSTCHQTTSAMSGGRHDAR